MYGRRAHLDERGVLFGANVAHHEEELPEAAAERALEGIGRLVFAQRRKAIEKDKTAKVVQALAHLKRAAAAPWLRQETLVLVPQQRHPRR